MSSHLNGTERIVSGKSCKLYTEQNEDILNAHRNKLALDFFNSKQEELDSLCKPFFNATGLKCFGYFRVFNNNKYIYLTTNIKVNNFFVKNIHKTKSVFEKQIKSSAKGEFHYFLWPENIKDPVLSGIHSLDVWNGFNMYRRLLNSVETYWFSTSIENNEMNNFYINNVHLLKKFINFFDQKFMRIINEYALSNLAIFQQGIDITPSNKNNLLSDLMKEKYSSSHYIFNHNFKKYILTKRESESLNFLAQGQTMKEIAKSMKISSRTVETMILNIKLKTNIKSKKELIKLYLSNFHVEDIFS